MKLMFLFLPLTLLLASCQPGSSTSSSPSSSTTADELRKSLRNNTAPKVNAGADQTVTASGSSATVTLQGSASDAENNITTYIVKNSAGTTIKNGNSASVFTSTISLGLGNHTLTFEARDSSNALGRDTVMIIVTAGAPAPGPAPGQAPAPAPSPTPSVPTGYSKCADEGGTCALDATKIVDIQYGANTSFISKTFQGLASVECTNTVFTDPLQGVGKACYSKVIGNYTPPAPAPGPAPAPAPSPNPSTGNFKWKPLRIGAGGYLTGMDISNDGLTKVTRADTHSAFVWDNYTNQWRTIVNAVGMPPEDAVPGGVYEIRVAPNHSNRIYMAFNGYIFRSNDRGATFTRTALAKLQQDPNGEYRTWGQKMAVDPFNPDVVYVGTPKNGLYVTRDGGVSYQAITQIPLSKLGRRDEAPGITGIVIDHRTSVDGRAKVIYAHSYGNGYYMSTDGGINWSLMNNGPIDVAHAKIATDGVLYAVGNNQTDWTSRVLKYENNTWSYIQPFNSDWHTVITDPHNPNRIVLAQAGGRLSVTSDRGASWQTFDNVTRSATNDIGWLAWANEGYMSAGDMYFDPITPNLLYFSQGIGFWKTNIPATQSGLVTWQSMSIGVEQLCFNQFITPPGGKTVIASWDRPIFVVEDPDKYPMTHGPGREESINMAWAVDYATTDPTFITAIINYGSDKSGYSTDGGRTWYKFASLPPLHSSGKNGGGIAAATPMNIVWAPNNNGWPYYTKDGGATWKPIVLPGAVQGEEGFGWAYYFKRHIITADRVLPNTFYLYHYGKGLYRSSDGGDSWTLIRAGQVVEWAYYHAKLRTVPGKAGHLFMTAGQDQNVAFRRSTDGGLTWQDIAGATNVYDFGFGKEAPGSDYPAIFMYANLNGRVGVYRSDDNAANWVFLGRYQYNSTDTVSTIAGDLNVYGKVYVGFGGSGGVYGQFE